ncbi:MAG: Gmad2 immunoglobulin-like domain-containing protein, partial [Candidatus Paceibacterota bacterium]
DVIESPLTITGEARGNWYFEATFPIILTNWDGLIIAEGFATADGEWMTEEFVPFTALLEFENPYTAGDPDFMKRGSLILQRANASGLPENDAALEIRVHFAE